MARPLRVQYPGAVYHITARGNARASIFADDADRQTFLRILGEVAEDHAWRLYAYCLMGNHYHLVVETPGGDLSRGMRQLNGIYTQRFNRRHDRVGHVLQGRFGAILIERDRYLLAVARYVALNPVRAEIVSHPSQWRWSSYRATAGLATQPPWLAVQPLLCTFAGEPIAARAAYRRFVEEGTGLPAPWTDVQGGVFLGTQPFVQSLAGHIGAASHESETPRAQRLAARPSLHDLFAGAQGRPARNRAIVKAHRVHKYSLGEIARQVGIHYSTVSRLVRQCANARPDP